MMRSVFRPRRPVLVTWALSVLCFVCTFWCFNSKNILWWNNFIMSCIFQQININSAVTAFNCPNNCNAGSGSVVFSPFQVITLIEGLMIQHVLDFPDWKTLLRKTGFCWSMNNLMWNKRCRKLLPTIITGLFICWYDAVYFQCFNIYFHKSLSWVPAQHRAEIIFGHII